MEYQFYRNKFKRVKGFLEQSNTLQVTFPKNSIVTNKNGEYAYCRNKQGEVSSVVHLKLPGQHGQTTSSRV